MVEGRGGLAQEADSLHRLTRRYFDAGRTALPSVALEFDVFECYFVRHASGGEPPSEKYAADLYLACACANGLDEALAVLERTLAGEVGRAIASIDSSRAFVEEILQTTRERLLVRKGAELGKIADYAGRASLRTWLCAVAIRRALSVLRRKEQQGHRPIDADDDRRLAQGGPEFEYLRGRYKRVFEDSVRRGIEQLSHKERLLLRLNLVDGMSIDTIAVAYQVGRSTAARWLASARGALLARAREQLHTALRLTSTELDSLGDALSSQLEVSILRLLARSAEEED